MLYLLPTGCCFVSMSVGFIALRDGRTDLAQGYTALLLGLLGLAVFKDITSVGLDALVWTALWAMVLLPALCALGLGALLGRWARTQARS